MGLAHEQVCERGAARGGEGRAEPLALYETLSSDVGRTQLLGLLSARSPHPTPAAVR